MLITVSQDRTNITLKSDVLSDFSVINTITINLTFNCDLVKSFTPIEDDITNTDEYVITASAAGVTTFDQGIWGAEILVVNTSQILIPDYQCTLIDVDLTCKLATYRNSSATENKKIEAVGDYIILRNIDDCPSDCEDYCLIYKSLSDVLTETNCQT